MCYHKRLIHGCGHYQWGGIFLACQTQVKYEKYFGTKGCEVMWSTSFCTYTTEKWCPKCAVTKAATDDKLATIKARIQAMKSTIEAHPKRKAKGEEAGPPGDEAGHPSESPATAGLASSPVEDKGEDCDDIEANEVMEEIKYLHTKVSILSDTLYPDPEPVAVSPGGKNPVPPCHDLMHRSLMLPSLVALVEDPVIR